MQIKQVTGMAKVSVMSKMTVMRRTPRVRTPTTASMPMASGGTTKDRIAMIMDRMRPTMALGFMLTLSDMLKPSTQEKTDTAACRLTGRA